MSRPKKDNAKDVVVTIRLTEDEKYELDRASSKTGKSVSEIAREGIKAQIRLIKYQNLL